MSDVEKKTPNKTGASGAAWSDGEKIAYLIVLCENEGKIDAKIGVKCTHPAGRSIISCRKLLVRLKEKHKQDIEKIKNGLPLSSAAGDGEATDTPEKPKATPKKRKSKVAEVSADANGEDGAAEGSPKKKATPRPRKKKGEAVEEVKSEPIEDEEVI